MDETYPVVVKTDGLFLSNGLPQSASWSHNIVIYAGPDDTAEDIFRKADARLSADGFSRMKNSKSYVTPLHQMDSTIDGKSRIYDRFFAPPVDWSKLPDWPAWSKLMADDGGRCVE